MLSTISQSHLRLTQRAYQTIGRQVGTGVFDVSRGAKVTQLIAVVDREEGGAESLAHLELEFTPLVTAGELLEKNG